MRSEDERAASVEEQRVRLGSRDPLQVKHVAVGEPEPGERERMLERLQSEPARTAIASGQRAGTGCSSTSKPSASGHGAEAKRAT